MSGWQTNTNEHLIRSNLWSTQLKEVLQDELMAMQYVDFITDFPDGDQVNIPSIGQAEVFDYAEGQAIRYTAMDTGNFTFSVTDYKSSGTYITEKMKQDSFYTSRLIASFVPSQNRAIMKAMESAILAVGPDGQTASNVNLINDARHRFIGSGTNERMTIVDFARAKFALDKGNVPAQDRIAIVDPSVGYELSTLTNIVNVSNNPRWEGIIETGLSTGMSFVRNIMGFDVYESQNLKLLSSSETISGVTAAAGVCNLFFSAAPGVKPFVGLIKQPPKVDSEFNKDLQREEYVTTARWGFKLFRPENLVTVITDTDQVYV